MRFQQEVFDGGGIQQEKPPIGVVENVPGSPATLMEAKCHVCERRQRNCGRRQGLSGTAFQNTEVSQRRKDCARDLYIDVFGPLGALRGEPCRCLSDVDGVKALPASGRKVIGAEVINERFSSGGQPEVNRADHSGGSLQILQRSEQLPTRGSILQ